jgi:hypothetical protein
MAYQVLTGRFIGRTEELARLCELLARAAAGEEGVRVLRGGCVPLGEEGVPFAPVIEALRGLACELDPAELEAVAGPARADLARLLPELAGSSEVAVADDVAGAGQASQGRLFTLLLGVVERLAAEAPLSEGNPFFTEELVLAGAAAGPGLLPPSLQEVLLARASGRGVRTMDGSACQHERPFALLRTGLTANGLSRPQSEHPTTSNTPGQRPCHPATGPPRQGQPGRLHRPSARRTSTAQSLSRRCESWVGHSQTREAPYASTPGQTGLGGWRCGKRAAVVLRRR